MGRQLNRNAVAHVGLIRRLDDARLQALPDRREADTKLRDELLSLRTKSVRKCLHRLVKAEKTRGNLSPTRLPFGVAAIDGKGLGRVPTWEHPDIQETHSSTDGPFGLFEWTFRERGARVRYRMWRADLDGGWLDWESGRRSFSDRTCPMGFKRLRAPGTSATNRPDFGAL